METPPHQNRRRQALAHLGCMCGDGGSPGWGRPQELSVESHYWPAGLCICGPASALPLSTKFYWNTALLFAHTLSLVAVRGCEGTRTLTFENSASLSPCSPSSVLECSLCGPTERRIISFRNVLYVRRSSGSVGTWGSLWASVLAALSEVTAQRQLHGSLPSVPPTVSASPHCPALSPGPSCARPSCCWWPMGGTGYQAAQLSGVARRAEDALGVGGGLGTSGQC